MSFPDPTAPQPQQAQPTQQDQAQQADQATTAPAPAPAGAPAEPTTYYCPACGKQVEYRQQCTGSPVAPHQPTEVVDAAELDGSPENHTPAPDSPGA